ncbi:hypothetical protein CS022_02920 [Veronia nyctiphanis]|uniref:N-acetyltransferase domain-containing protein n=1 Tax=Veronia nyctiphanis TaxID=1278244 RepID=A0A4Q0YTE6_9GAMM|nr:hypothetical protein [Veronia nyctiphanis]RXJ74542.1 hypothetical protein CS022_02920 [Veronia nyctiphanis]
MRFKTLKSIEQGQYSKLLRQFETQFIYPLGDETFNICHGLSSGQYYDFFNSLGQAEFFVLEEKDAILGMGCAVLREVSHGGKCQRFWYLCDFKLHRSARGKGFFVRLLVKKLLSYYLKSNKILAVNMSPPDNNWLTKKIESAFFFLRINTRAIYFYEWSVDEYHRVWLSNQALLSRYALYTNVGSKDIVINGEIRPIYHLVDKNHASINLLNHRPVKLDALSSNPKAMVMLSTSDESVRIELKSNRVSSNYTAH